MLPGSSSPSPPAPTHLVGSLLFLPCFSEVQQSYIQKIIRGMKPTTCCLDPFPTTLLKSYISILSPIITQVVNLSLQTAHVPPALKAAVIRPLLKKPSLDPDNLANYRPISNLPFLSKVLEKTVAITASGLPHITTCLKNFSQAFVQPTAPRQLCSG